ncbi:ZIC1 protein, partial [Loa loa]
VTSRLLVPILVAIVNSQIVAIGRNICMSIRMISHTNAKLMDVANRTHIHLHFENI